jgi:hypothetical protein
MPHTSVEDQTINGYYLPKGTIIQPNMGWVPSLTLFFFLLLELIDLPSIRFMLTNPAVWGDPEVFRPERFLPEHNSRANELPNPSQIIFGFGIR